MTRRSLAVQMFVCFVAAFALTVVFLSRGEDPQPARSDVAPATPEMRTPLPTPTDHPEEEPPDHDARPAAGGGGRSSGPVTQPERPDVDRDSVLFESDGASTTEGSGGGPGGPARWWQEEGADQQRPPPSGAEGRSGNEGPEGDEGRSSP